MRPINPALLAAVPVALASQTSFSVHDDILAFPQYEVVFSESFISDTTANLILDDALSINNHPAGSNTKSLESHNHDYSRSKASKGGQSFNPGKETYELMLLNGEQLLCAIPIVDIPLKNETSEAEARAAEQKELARATNRGGELLQDLQGNCLYYVSGWWSYAFCYNSEITQFHQLPPRPGKPILPPERDMAAPQFVLGRVKGRRGRADEWGNEIEPRETQKIEPPKTELQTKGDVRYLVQRMEGGTTCDKTGRPRRVEVQYHCNMHVTDRIEYIKEVTTCAYLMVVYTSRLCNDVAFMPPKDIRHSIVCQTVIPEDEFEYRVQLKKLEDGLETNQKLENEKVTIGGIVVGGGRWMSKEGRRIPIPADFGTDNFGKQIEIIGRANSKAEGGQVEMASDAKLKKMDLDPDMVEQLRKEVQNLAKDKGWEIKVVDQPGETREILGIVDGDGVGDEDEDADADANANGADDVEDKGDNSQDSKEGSQEIFKDEL